MKAESLAFLDMVYVDLVMKIHKLKETKTNSLVVSRLELESLELLLRVVIENEKGKKK